MHLGFLRLENELAFMFKHLFEAGHVKTATIKMIKEILESEKFEI